MSEAPAPAPRTLVERVREYVGAVGTADENAVDDATAEATELVKNWIGKAAIPDAIRDRAIIEVAADLFYRRMARNGVMEFGGTDLAPFRIARDPMKAAYPLLSQFIPGGFA
ncbi:MAG: hypothetical protein ACTH30_05425 [Leucobacter sp.]